jgi:hypothetical protein
MRLRLSNRVPCRLERGELRRVPQDSKFGLVGYHVCCPRCGFVTVAVHGNKEQVVTEAMEHGELLVSFAEPLRCTYCAVLIHVDHGEACLEEDEHVRNLHYR